MGLAGGQLIAYCRCIEHAPVSLRSGTSVDATAWLTPDSDLDREHDKPLGQPNSSARRVAPPPPAASADGFHITVVEPGAEARDVPRGPARTRSCD
jgi:hypothetical protein